MNFDFLISLFFPRRCLACGAGIPDGALCATCERSLTRAPARTLFCGECRARLFGDKKRCHPDFPYILGAPGDYENAPLRSLVHALKFRGMRSAATPLAALMIDYMVSLGTILHGCTVIPIPLSGARRHARGFNQSELIAQPLTKAFRLPFMTRTLIRTRNTKPQSETRTLAERRENLRGCFAVRGPEHLCGKTIILIDDVVTSGTTFLEAAKALRAVGAEKIYALAAAKVEGRT